MKLAHPGTSKLIAVSLALAAAHLARADEMQSTADDLGPRTHESPPLLPPDEVISVPRRTVGQVLTITGLLQLAIGTVGMSVGEASFRSCMNQGRVNPTDCGMGTPFIGELYVGIPNLVAGAGLTLVGIPLWVTGAKKKHPGQRTADDQGQSEALVPRLTFSGNGAAVNLPF